ncbi:protein JINGUBANG-like [Andrographis paniculata]|uniref:protein JINGUBANG-like n=1 Tax=Andrographis paniculata TaxID=175694 RepID=UPI0021E75352|nr:protein JINGUBANG-like [Andrographis paniculata]
MGRFLPGPFPAAWNSDNPQLSDHLPTVVRTSSSSNSSLSSQSSLPSVPSLTPPLPDQTAAAHYSCSATLRGHSSYVFSLALAGNRLYSGASDGEMRAWDRTLSNSSNDYSPRDNVVGEGYSAVKSIIISGDKLFSAHQDQKIRVWRIDGSPAPNQRYKMVAILPTLSDSCMSLFDAGKYVRIRRHKTRTWVHHVDAVSGLALSPESSLLYSVSWDRSFKIWRTSDYKCIESVQDAHADAINAVVLSAADGFVYTASADKTIKVWRRCSGAAAGDRKHSLVSTLEKHKSAVNALALSSDGAVLYSGACDRSIIVWRRRGGDSAASPHMVVAGALRGHTKAILCLATVSDLVCSGSADRTVRIWRRSDGGNYSFVAALEGHSTPVKCLTAEPGGDGDGDDYQIYSGALDCEIRVWQIHAPRIN